MPTRSEYNGDYDVGLVFKRIEDELIDSMMRNLARHNKEEAELGFDWTQWQTEQLESLERYRRTNARKFPRQFREINRKMDRAIRKAEKTGRNEEEINILETLRKRKELRDQAAEEGNLQNGFFSVDNSKLDALLNATQNDMQKAEYAVLRRANDQYRKIIFDAQVYYDTGAGTFEKALDMATHDFLSRGIDSIEYKNGARHTISDYADMVLKTAETRAYLTGQGQIRQEWGEHYVIVNKRGDVTCPKCAKWVGRVLIDDVYSGGQSDGKTPLLSTAMSQGFLHPRCKDIFTTYFPGISTPPDPATKEEIREAEEVEKLEAREQYAQRQAEKYERLTEHQTDATNQKRYSTRAAEWQRESFESNERKMSLIGDIINGRDEEPEHINWPPASDRITRDQYREFVAYARGKGVDVSGFKFFDGDIGAVKEYIDQTGDMLDLYPELRQGNKRIVIERVDHITGDQSAFAATYGHIIKLSNDAYRDAKVLIDVYANGVADGTFVAGSSIGAIPLHEFGHLLENRYGLNPMEIAKRVTGYKSDVEIIDYVTNNLSGRAGAYGDGSEILAECFASVFGSDEINEFALQMVEECNTIILERGGSVNVSKYEERVLEKKQRVVPSQRRDR